MPRFTIGSLGAGLLLALVAVAVLHSWSGAIAARVAVDTGRMTPLAGPQPTAIDPVRGSLALGQEKANDYTLEDTADWAGGLDSATW